MNAGHRLPARPPVALTAGVLAAHWLALRSVPATVQWPSRESRLSVALRPPPPDAGSAAREGPEPSRSTPGGQPPPPARPQTVARPAAARPSGAGQAASPSAPRPVEARQDLERASATIAAPDTPATSPPVAVAVPAPAAWRYEVNARRRGMPVAGQAQLAWQHDGREYQALLQLQLPGAARVQRSVGRLGPAGLQPQRFSDRLRSEEAAHFDRDGGRIVFSSNRPAAPLQAGAQDRLSVLLQLAALVAADPARFAPGATVLLQTAGTREAPEWAFVVEGPEPLELPGGRVQALKLTRAPQREYDLRLELWLGPGPDYGPVRLRLTAPNGDWTDLQWSGTDKG